MTIDPSLLEILACPRCHAPLREDPTSSELVCTSAECGLAYPIRDGIPVLLIDEARGGPRDGQDGAASPGPPA